MTTEFMECMAVRMYCVLSKLTMVRNLGFDGTSGYFFCFNFNQLNDWYISHSISERTDFVSTGSAQIL